MEEDELKFFDHYGGAGTQEATTPPDAEARYEEGIPLMNSEAQLDWLPTLDSDQVATASKGLEHHSEARGNLNNEDTNNAGDNTSSRPDPSDRKTTEQVLASLLAKPQYSIPQDDAADSTIEVPRPESDSQSLTNSRGIPEVQEEKRADDEQSPGQENVPQNPVESQVGLKHKRSDTQSDPVAEDPEEGNHEIPIQARSDRQRAEEDKAPASEEDLAAMWKAALDDDDFLIEGESADPNFFEDDGKGFMDDDLAEWHPDPQEQSSAPSFTGGSQDVRTDSHNFVDAGPPSMVTKTYIPEGVGMRNSFSPIPVTSQSTWEPPYTVPPSISPHQARPSLPVQAQSFADQSKGGYTSPYDIPLDISRPKKRAHLQQSTWGMNSHPRSLQAPPAPPPRSSSMFTGQASMVTQTPLQSPPSYNSSPVSVPPSGQSLRVSSTRSEPSAVTQMTKPNKFFEELPITSKPRPQSALGRSRLQRGPDSPPFARENTSQPPPRQDIQLQAPERVNPYAIPPQPGPSAFPAPGTAQRYSPAPPAQFNASQGRTRYTTPPTSVPPPSHVLPFQPRTSSPLAHHQKTYQLQSNTSDPPPMVNGGAQSSSDLSEPQSISPHESELKTSLLSPEKSTDEAQLQFQADTNSRSLLRRGLTTTPPPVSSPSMGLSPPKRATSTYAPQYRSHIPDNDPVFAPPRRSQTQSPGKLFSGSTLPSIPQEPYQRPASVHEATPSTLPSSHLTNLHSQQPSHRRTASQVRNFISPADGREVDPLQRWKGCPVFVFGFGGTIASSFPKHIPRYAAGQLTPMIKCSPGEVQLRNLKDVLPIEDHVVKFPGPLKSKGKKKEVLNWLDNRTASLESELSFFSQGGHGSERHKQFEEKVLLWKMLRVLVEHDGVLEGNLDLEKRIRSVLSPETDPAGINNETTPFYGVGVDLVGISRPGDSSMQADPIDPGSVEALRRLLIVGEREKAVWHAVDKRLWAHAMLISSTLSKDVWKQVAQEFVRQEVKLIGNNTESLAALYEIFAGNWEESIDELVPPSARAGLQMVSKASSNGPAKNALDGLHRWRETLSLVLSNRSVGDTQAILALGRLLSGYGRTEAAHICYLFARSSMVLGGSDNPQAHVALLGADLVQRPLGNSADVDAVLLTEVYEYTISVLSSPSPLPAISHLQGYKLCHAFMLAEYGYRLEAQQYCEAIANSLKMTTKLAPYYHTQLFSALDDLTKRLQQSPKDGSASWISKPNMDKVSGSVWAKFNSFVAGDDSDAPSNASRKDGESEVGPFANVVSGTPTISQSPSNSDLYGSYPGALRSQSPVAGLHTSRYAPSVPYVPHTAAEQHSISSYESPKSSPYEPVKAFGQQHRDVYHPNIPSGHDHTRQDPSNEHWKSSQYSPHLPNNLQSSEDGSANVPLSLKPRPLPYQQGAFHATSAGEGNTSVLEPSGLSYSSAFTPSSYNPTPYQPTSSYEPDSQADQADVNAYQPPIYNSTYANENTSPVDEIPRKFAMDEDDEDMSSNKADTLKSEKARKDKEADEAFKRAAAADAKRDSQSAEKKGWFGGWFGKKDPNAAPGPIKAKLGEESSFYYDPELKKWINKKGGAAASTPSATPPPPKGPPLRAVSSPPAPRNPDLAGARPPIPTSMSNASAPMSSSMPSVTPLPPSGPTSATGTPQRTDSPGESQSMLMPPSLANLIPGGGRGGPSPGPPSRPTTSTSNASSIDDLIGAPAVRKGGTVKKSKKGRGYVDVMAKP